VFEPSVKQTTINWRIYSLVQAGIISRIGRGKYTLGKDRIFLPLISSSLKKTYTKLHNQFPYLHICIWNTSAINEFMLHQPGIFFTIVEVERDAVDGVFYFLKASRQNVLLNPSAEIFSRYADQQKDTLVVRSLVSEAPTQKVNAVQTTTLEKLLVDIFCDESIFSAQQGSEMSTIFREAYSRYTVHENRMMRYADRRNKKTELEKFLNNFIILQ